MVYSNRIKQIKRVTPKPVWRILTGIYFSVKAIQYRIMGRPRSPGETSGAKARRMTEGFFEKYCTGKGLDVGYGGDPVVEGCIGWDFEDGDAQFLNGIGDSVFDFVYSSHTLEHMVSPETALSNWWRVLKPGGFLVLYVPHRDLYEKKKELPSRWNEDHKHFFLPDNDEPPATVGVLSLIKRTLSGYSIEYIKECKDGHTITDPELHSDGEYSIEAVIRKNLPGAHL